MKNPRSQSIPLRTRIRRSRAGRKLGRAIEKKGKALFLPLLTPLYPSKNYTLDQLEDVRSILLVRNNFRIGNTLISAQLIPAVQHRFPRAQIHFLGAENTLPLLENMGLQSTYGISRHHGYRWLAFLKLIRRARARRYDVVIDCSRGSTTTAILCKLVRARYYVAEVRNRASRMANVPLVVTRQPTVYEDYGSLAKVLQGTDVRLLNLPYYAPRPEELERAEKWLQKRRRNKPQRRQGYIALFVGGHLDKRWHKASWKKLIQELERFHIPCLLFSGPEEMSLIDEIQGLPLNSTTIVPMQDLRSTAALCAQTRIVITPDTGSMHLAAALHLPVISILQTDTSKRYAPHQAQDISLFQPTPLEVIKTVLQHPSCPRKPAIPQSAPRKQEASAVVPNRFLETKVFG